MDHRPDTKRTVILDRDQSILNRFDGARSVHSVRRVAQRDACASGKRRNDADGPIFCHP